MIYGDSEAVFGCGACTLESIAGGLVCVTHTTVDTGNAGKLACSMELLKGQIRIGGSITSLHLPRYQLSLPISPKSEI